MFIERKRRSRLPCIQRSLTKLYVIREDARLIIDTVVCSIMEQMWRPKLARRPLVTDRAQIIELFG